MRLPHPGRADLVVVALGTRPHLLLAKPWETGECPSSVDGSSEA